MITNFFIPELNNHDVQEMWFQQDGAICHTARATIDLLKDTFGDRLISRFGPVNWPTRSCDLTPLDYFLWGYVKSLVYADKPQTLDHLEDNIRRVIADIRPQMLEKVIENWTSRLDYIRASRGSPMPEIIFKIPEFIAISGALDHVLNSNKASIWILTDSRSSIQYLNWPKIMDRTGLDSISKLVRLGQRKQVCLQWIPSHVGVPGNESSNKFDLKKPPALHWYAAKSPGLSLQCRSSKVHQMALACFRTGHLRNMTFVQREKSFFTCPCSLPASPAYLLDCWSIFLGQLLRDQYLEHMRLHIHQRKQRISSPKNCMTCMGQMCDADQMMSPLLDAKP
ncbi:RNase H domain-containing protein [Trichonephila clavipes]|nr:RNase H domain-containing protein [Trichonephila clavipes]